MHSGGGELERAAVVLLDRRSGGKPLFSVLVAVYNVSHYIGATLSSLERQSITASEVEWILIDDGSTDDSLQKALGWARRQSNAIVITQPNGGPAAARQTGLSHARGVWVTAIDPDDIVERDYLEAAKRFHDADVDERISMLTTRVYVTDGRTGLPQDTHPLGFKYRGGKRKVISLLRDPAYIQLGATAFLRRDRLVERGLTYDTRIEPTFEDGNLIVRYLAYEDEPIVGLVSDAHYYYRKRVDGSSAVQSSWQKESRYYEVLKYGYLNALQAFEDLGKTVPRWAQWTVLYDLYWYFREDQSMTSKLLPLAEEQRETFLGLLREIFRHIDGPGWDEFPLNRVNWAMRQSVALGMGLVPEAARLFVWSSNKRRTSFTVIAKDHETSIEVFVNGLRLSDAELGVVERRYFNMLFAVEHTYAVPPGDLAVFADGVPLRPLRAGALPEVRGAKHLNVAAIEKGPVRYSLLEKARRRLRLQAAVQARSQGAVAIEKLVGYARASLRTEVGRPVGELTPDQVKALRDLAASPEMRRRYAKGWLLLDRPDRAQDNGEHLMRHIMLEHPEITAHFALRRTSPDWARLEAEGFPLVDWDTDECVAASLNAVVRISSDATAEMMYPRTPRKYFGQKQQPFVFLQHGVTKDDISRWLNGKDISLMITSTSDEYEYVAGDRSPYTLKRDECRLTGFPRYDALMRLADRRPTHPQPFLLVMPTWRQDLRDLLARQPDQESRVRVLEESDFIREWRAFLSSEPVVRLARSGGKVVFLVHPSFDRFADDVKFADHVVVRSLGAVALQELMSECTSFVTDYSSIAFDLAFIGRPVTYFQFDRDAVFAGAHTTRPGYFDYERDGFGPVLFEATGAAEAAVYYCAGAPIDPEYRRRSEVAFPFRDDSNSERVVCAISEVLGAKR